ncbi:MAG: carbohydrate porin, partial [Succinivibrio sp.]
TLAEVDGTEWRFVTSFAMQSGYQGAWQDTDGYDTDRAHFALTQAYLRVTGLLDSDPDATLWVGRKYLRQDSHVVDCYWRNVTGNGIGFENLSLGFGKLRANWTRRDDSRNFTAYAQGYKDGESAAETQAKLLEYDDNGRPTGNVTKLYDITHSYPEKTATNMFDVSYVFPVYDGATLDLGYTLVAPQRYASEYSNYGYKLNKEVGNGHLFTAKLDQGLFGGWNTTVLRYVKGSTAGSGYGSHTYTTDNQGNDSYSIDLISMGSLKFTDNLGMLYHTWFNFGNVKDYDGIKKVSRDFQVVVRPMYQLTKMTRIMLEGGFTTNTFEKTGEDRVNTQRQKVTLAYGITPDAGNLFSRPEIRIFATYKHVGHKEHIATYSNGYTVMNPAGEVESLCAGKKSETFFGAQAEAWF